jgi:DNA-binding MarR family transcriptional regulator
MDFVPGQAQGHLIVAAIRVLTYLGKRPPTEEEIARHLGISREIVLHILRGLEGPGIVQVIKSPFEVRYDIGDHKLIERLPAESKGPDMGREIEDFHKKAEDRQRQIEQMMRDADPDLKTREKVSKIEEEFRRFSKKRPSGSPFGTGEGGDSEG